MSAELKYKLTFRKKDRKTIMNSGAVLQRMKNKPTKVICRKIK